MIAGERLETYETERIRADGVRIAVSLTVSQIKLPRQGVVGASVIARDITGERRRRKAQDFLLAASRLLDSSLDPDQTARTIVATAVPELAELCVLDFLREDGWFGDSIVAAVDPEAAARLEQIRREIAARPGRQAPGRPGAARRPADGLARPQGARRGRRRRPERGPPPADGRRRLQLRRGGAADRPRRRSSAASPSSTSSATSATTPPTSSSSASSATGPRWCSTTPASTTSATQIAEQPAARPATAAPGRGAAGLEISVVFEAAGRGIEIGGDLYDVLPTEDGCWILVGDVAGKGSAAAGVSVAVRHAVRGLTREIDDPGEVLLRVNDLLLSRQQPQRLRHRGAGAAAPPRRELAAEPGQRRSPARDPRNRRAARGSSAAAPCSAPGRTPRSHATRRRSGREDTLVLCTDGWLEAGPVAAHHDAEALARMAHSLAELSLEELTERLRADAVSRSAGSLRDDLVVLAARPSTPSLLGVGAEAPEGDVRRPRDQPG